MPPVKLSEVSLDSDLQPRETITESVVDEYAEAMIRGETFPPVVLFNDGAAYWLADGYHRYKAAQKAGLHSVSAEFRTGTRHDALRYALSANTTHGLRRSQADRRRAVLIALREFGELSDREIGRMVKVDGKTVAKYRAELSGVASIGDSAHTKEVVHFFDERLWLTTQLIDDLEASFKTLEPGYADDLRHIVVPEVRRCVHRLKALGLQEINGPITIIVTDPKGIRIQISSLCGWIWWAVVIDDSHASIGPDGGGRCYTNGHHQIGFDSIIHWLFVNGGMDVLPSRLAEMRIGKPPENDKDDFPYWDNILAPEMAKCDGCGKEVRRWGKNGMHHLDAGYFCPTCYAIQPTQIVDGKEVPKNGRLESEAV